MTHRRAWWLIGIMIGSAACRSHSSDAPAQTADLEDSVTVDEKPEYWAARLGTTSADERREALTRLGEYGREASSYAPLVLPYLADADEGTGASAAWALAQMGMGAHPLLIARLDSRNPRERRRAAYGVGEMGQSGAVAIERLRELATDSDRGVRSMAIWAIDQVTMRAMQSDPTMLMNEGLDGSTEQRLQAVDRLGARAHSNRFAVRRLIALMSDSVPEVRARSIKVLSEAGPSVLPSLSLALSHRNRRVRNGALLAISRMKREF